MLWWQTLRRTSAIAVVAVLATAGMTLPSSGNAGALAIPTFSFSPMVAPGAAPRGSFHYDVLPGQTINDSVVLTNQTAQEEEFQIWPTDALNTQIGGAFALRPLGYPMTGVGTWINTHLGAGVVYGLQGNQAVTINFSVTVPKNATPGYHAGGIEALDVTPVSQPSGRNSRFLVHRGIGAAVFIQVAGPLHASAAVSNIATRSSVPAIGFGHSSANVTFQLENTGNTILSGHVQATVTDLFGRTVKTFKPVGVQAFIPGARYTVEEPVWNNLPFIGPETVHVTFVSPGMQNTTGDSTFWIFPWLFVLLVLIVLGLLIWRLIVWRRNRADSTGQSDDGGGPDDDGSPSHADAERVDTVREPSAANVT
jgi:hypothetical protein